MEGDAFLVRALIWMGFWGSQLSRSYSFQTSGTPQCGSRNGWKEQTMKNDPSQFAERLRGAIQDLNMILKTVPDEVETKIEILEVGVFNREFPILQLKATTMKKL